MGWGILLLLAVCGILVFLHMYVLPRYLLRFRNEFSEAPGRGLARVRDPRADSVVYEPDRRSRDYLSEYIISERGGKKYLICRIEDAIRFIGYDVLLFGRDGRFFRALRVQEKISSAGFTDEIELPAKTSYASVIVNCVDGVRMERKLRLSAAWFVLYLALCLIVNALGFFAIRFCIADIFGGLFWESYLNNSAMNRSDACFGAVVVVVSLIVTWIAVKLKNRRIMKKGKKNAGN